MTVSFSLCRRSLLICAALLVVVGLVVAAGVIPPVEADTFALATPQGAVRASWINVASQFLAAIAGGHMQSLRDRSFTPGS